MNLAEKLMRIDKEKLKERETRKIKSRRLSMLMGEETEITIQQLSGQKVNDLTQMAYTKKGNRDMSKMYDVNLMYCVEGVVDPPLKDKALMEAFDAATPKELAAKLFDAESAFIANEIADLTGINDDTEDEVKN